MPLSIWLVFSESLEVKRWGSTISDRIINKQRETHSYSQFIFVVIWIPSMWIKNSKKDHNIITRSLDWSFPLKFTATRCNCMNNMTKHRATLVVWSCWPSPDNILPTATSYYRHSTRIFISQALACHWSWLTLQFLIITVSIST